jgi:hypothetical protein
MFILNFIIVVDNTHDNSNKYAYTKNYRSVAET